MDKGALLIALEVTLAATDEQMSLVMDDAERMGISPYRLQNRDGSYSMVPLLSARATILAALASLRTT